MWRGVIYKGRENEAEGERGREGVRGRERETVGEQEETNFYLNPCKHYLWNCSPCNISSQGRPGVQSFQLAIYLSTRVSIYATIYPSFVLSIHASIFPYIYLFIYASIYPSFYLSTNTSIYPSFYLSTFAPMLFFYQVIPAFNRFIQEYR